LCEAAVQACRNDPGLKIQLAEMLHAQGRVEEALRLATAAIDLRPDWWLPYLRRGTFLMDMKNWAAAIVDLERCHAMNPRYHWALVPLSVALLRNGQAEEATRGFQRALELNAASTQAVIHHQWAEALAAIGQLDAALEHHAVSCASEHCKPYMASARARLLARVGQGSRRSG
jgi:tetratricopeptide (TPR) repeat protein